MDKGNRKVREGLANNLLGVLRGFLRDLCGQKLFTAEVAENYRRVRGENLEIACTQMSLARTPNRRTQREARRNQDISDSAEVSGRRQFFDLLDRLPFGDLVECIRRHVVELLFLAAGPLHFYFAHDCVRSEAEVKSGVVA